MSWLAKVRQIEKSHLIFSLVIIYFIIIDPLFIPKELFLFIPALFFISAVTYFIEAGLNKKYYLFLFSFFVLYISVSLAIVWAVVKFT